MQKAIIALFAAALLIGMFACEKKPQTLADYIQMSAESGKPVLIDFYTDW